MGGLASGKKSVARGQNVVLLNGYGTLGGQSGRTSVQNLDSQPDRFDNLDYLVVKNSWGYVENKNYLPKQKQLAYRLRDPNLPKSFDIITSQYLYEYMKNSTKSGFCAFVIPENGLSLATRKKIRRYDRRCKVVANNPNVEFGGSMRALCLD